MATPTPRIFVGCAVECDEPEAAAFGDRASAGRGPGKASAEYLGLWRDDVSDYIPVELPEAVTDWNVLERPYKSGVVYNAYVDAATGLGSSSFTLAIAHREADDTVVLDVLRERRPPFIPRDTVKEFADLVKSVHGDDFARGFHDTLWKDNGIRFEDKKFTTSDNYLHLLLKLLAKQVRFIDSATLRSQLALAGAACPGLRL